MGKVLKRSTNKDGILQKLETARKALYRIRSNIPNKTDFIHQTDKNKIDKMHRNYELLLKTVDYFDARVKSETGITPEQIQILTYLKENPGASTEAIGYKVILNKTRKTNITIIGSNLHYLQRHKYVTSNHKVYRTYHKDDPNRQVLNRINYWTITTQGKKMV
jgi:hypothetical protein